MSELFCYLILKNPNAVGIYAIYLSVIFVIYFSFRDGIKGGVISAFITVLYYFYIIYTRHHQGRQLVTSIETTLVLGIIYFLLAAIIGWLKQTIDGLIEHESDEKNRLQTIIQQLPVGVLVTDSNGHIVQGNKQVELILGKQLRRGIMVEDVLPSQWPLAQALATGKSVKSKEFTLEKSDGKKIYLQISASLVHSKKGKVIAAASIINDITTQKEIEARKDDFVNMASHELKTPITSMKLYMESLATRIKKYNDERGTQALKSIQHQTEKLQQLVNDLLDVSRLQTGKLAFNKDEFKIEDLIKETIEGFTMNGKQKNIIYSGKTSAKVVADRFRIYQVLANLITNALKYSKRGAKVNVSIKKTKKGIVVSVKDFGIGIAKDQQKKIFDRLYQVIGDKEKTFPGLGMGLYISSEIIKRHHGKIWVESKKGKGSTFYFSLPVKKET